MANDLMTNMPKELSQELADRLVAGIAESRAATPVGGGKPIMRLLKSGQWAYGVSDDVAQDGSEWAINPLTVMHGWVCWSDYPGNTKNELLGEVMSPMFEPKPPLPQPISGTSAWKDQRVCDMKCLNGEDEGVEVQYKTSSIGGLRAFDALTGAIQAQVAKDKKYPVPVVTLGASHYDHQKYGQIFNPTLTIVDWLTMTGEPRDKPEEIAQESQPQQPAPQPRASAAPRRQRPENRV